MSWVDKVRNGIVINTGDGKRWTPKWKNCSIVTEYQTAEFNFINVAGSLVKQEQPIGNKYAIDLYFDGPDHLDTAADFRISCNDKRPWTIEHPLYDLIFVKCPTLTFDNFTSESFTKVTGTMIETILEGPPNVSINPLDQIPIQFETANEDLAVSLQETVTPPDINTLTEDNALAKAKSVPIITNITDFENYTNAFNTAQTYINTATATPLLMMRSFMHVLTLPAEFDAAVRARIGVLVDTFNALRANLFGLTSVVSKRLFQNKQGALITAMCKAAATPLNTDFKNSQTILDIIDIIIAGRTRFIADLDTLQSTNASSPLSFVADAKGLTSLNELVNTTISALYNLSLSARSERNIYVEYDTNWIILAHRLYGLDAADANLSDLIEENQYPDPNHNFLQEYLQVPKGRKVVYYV